jgi:hypothetical protein
LKAEQQADGKKVPKWSKKARRQGIFLGFSGEHLNTVALVLDPKTGHISAPQYHVVFDEKFTTIIGAGDELLLSLTEWMEIFTDGHWLHES